MDKKRIKIGLDVDDTLMPFNEIAIDLANKANDFSPPLSLNEITSWETPGRIGIIRKFYTNRDLYKNQKPYPGAIDFVRTLTETAEVYFVTAVYEEMKETRRKQLKQFFPAIPEDHYIFTDKKLDLDLDVLLDDAPHNIIGSKIRYPILMERPWNQNIKNAISVCNYKEFLQYFTTDYNRRESPRL